ncbi:flagellar motor protein MotB [Tanticharoenia sakaeratensis]|uniref:Chemotaxis MotB protein n=1 Tax=Tanticharoenia sakaeratensis NBRC 103193 TaxID=1231623 RepID=A0A0D6MN40_9PROT|nr:flagellar motor protein MotB [Tanticharoenia sakaeratensis]GAN55099.1 chemotaxis MotB protein [Tanticharoenia sakaeratensis NBRC 103193]GBQ20212.1 chemotaxis protein MotB [Tanticharoenia sakaeratensis NBRC 103193]
MAAKHGSNSNRSIIIRREEVVSGGHHGGSWKIAYADFVTAMMAFFLVMWLINATTEQQRRGIANFFNPLAERQDAPPADSVMPAMGSPLAKTRRAAPASRPLDQQQAQRDVTPPPEPTPAALRQSANGILNGGGRAEARALTRPGVEDGAFSGVDRPRIVPIGGSVDPDPSPPGNSAQLQASWDNAARHISSALAAAPDLRAVRDQIKVGVKHDGLHIELADSELKPMFALGAAVPNAYAKVLLQTIAPFLLGAPGTLSVLGYTDAAPYRPGHVTNWTLSAERADSARDVLVTAGFPDWRIGAITGHGARGLALPKQPLDAANRRVVLVLGPDPKSPNAATGAN